jgi:hypothetical protein
MAPPMKRWAARTRTLRSDVASMNEEVPCVHTGPIVRGFGFWPSGVPSATDRVGPLTKGSVTGLAGSAQAVDGNRLSIGGRSLCPHAYAPSCFRPWRTSPPPFVLPPPAFLDALHPNGHQGHGERCAVLPLVDQPSCSHTRRVHQLRACRPGHVPPRRSGPLHGGGPQAVFRTSPSGPMAHWRGFPRSARRCALRKSSTMPVRTSSWPCAMSSISTHDR